MSSGGFPSAKVQQNVQHLRGYCANHVADCAKIIIWEPWCRRADGSHEESGGDVSSVKKP